VNILQEFGIDPEDFRWQDLALCAGMDTELFFDKYVEDSTIAEEVDELCLHCPVFAYCHREGKEGSEWGVWGGVYLNGAGKEDEPRNAHKTFEVRQRIEELLNE
jgi:hypothetical protein